MKFIKDTMDCVYQSFHSLLLAYTALSVPAFFSRVWISAGLSSFLVFSANVFATDDNSVPRGGQIVAGSGNITQSGLNTRINQNSSSLFIDWDSFNVGVNSQVNFIQPNASSVALNRILGQNPSQIHGQINANGHVVLLNPHGVLFGSTASVSVGGLVATSLSISPDDFMNGNYVFSDLDGVNGSVVNYGLINASTGGSVTLLGEQVENHGLIVANLGAVNLAAGREAVLTFDNEGLLGVRVTEEVLQEDLGVDPAVLNTGEINAAGGRILLTASVSEDIFSQAVNHGEVREATGVVLHEDGSFTLSAGWQLNDHALINTGDTPFSPGAGADVVNTGNLDVSSSESSIGNGAGGRIAIIGENVTSSGNILANAENADGGNIELHANDTVLLTENSLTSARSGGTTPGQGGEIKILGSNVGLFDESVVDASGGDGGEILIGGDRQGLNPAIRNAAFVYLGEDTQVYADGLANTTGTGVLDGNGGRIIVFAENTARIHGGLHARGGLTGGNGGFIETSGLRGFEISSAPDVSAANGLGGEWLIDPFNITIIDGSGNVTGSSPFEPTVTGATLGIDLIETALDNGDVTITTGSTGGEDGNIIWGEAATTAELDINGTGTNTLTLTAANNITFVNGSIIDSNLNSGDSINLILNANNNGLGSGQGIIDLRSSTLLTYGGDFTSRSNSFISTNATIDTTGRENLNGGDIDITATTGNIDVGILTTNGGVADRVSGGPGVPGLDAGDVTLTATLGNVTASSAIDARGTTGEYRNSELTGQNGGLGGDVSVNAGGSVSVAAITVNGGNASGDNDTSGTLNEANGGNAGTIELIAGTSVSVNGALFGVGGRGVGEEHNNPPVQGIGGDGGMITITANLVDINSDINVSRGAENQGALAGVNEGTVDINISGNDGGVTIGRSGAFTSLLNILGGSATGSQTLTGSTDNVNWIVDGADSGHLELSTGDALNIQFSGFESLTGNSGNDTFNLTEGGSISGTIDGGTGANVLQRSNTTGINDWALTGEHEGTLNGGIFSNIQTLTGSTGATDTLTGRDQNNTWSITNVGDGSVAQDIMSPTDTVSFTSMENLTGGIGDDVFDLAQGASITGTIDGGTGSNTLQRSNTSGANAWILTGQHTGTLNGDDFENIQTLTGSASVTDTLTGRDQNNLWSISGSGTGSVAQDTMTPTDTINFTRMEDLNGGSGNDTFNLAEGGLVTGTINGGTGANTLQSSYTSGTNAWILTGEYEGTLNGRSFSNIQTLTGSSSVVDTLTGRDQNNTWVVTSAGVGTVEESVATPSDSVNFSNMENLTGGTGNDSFSLNTVALISTINGGSGGDSLEIVNGNSSWTVDLSNDGNVTDTDTPTNITNFLSVETQIGSVAGNDSIDLSAFGNAVIMLLNYQNFDQIIGSGIGTLQGIDGQQNNWTIDGAVDDGVNDGAVNGVEFIDFATLLGGSGIDVFTFAGAGSIGLIDGNGGNNEIVGSESATNAWVINAANGGSVNNNNFVDIQTLTGGDTVDDTFTFELDPSASGVTINGRGHVTQDAVALLAGLTGVTLQVGSFTNIEAYTGNVSDTNILQGSSGNNDWQITGANAGTINGSSFSNFARIQGWTDGGSGVSNDTFTFAGALGSISQLIDGNGGNNEIVGAENATNAWVIDSANGGSVNSNTFLDIQTLTGGDTVDDIFTFELDPSASGVTINGRGHVTEDVVALGASLANVTLLVGSFTNIEAYTGNASDTNILQGSSGNNDWQITGANAGTINGSSFSNFARIQGWTDGGSGVSNDTFTFAGALGSISQLIDGNGGNNEIVGAENATNAWVIDSANGGSVNSNTFLDIQTLTGGDTVDDTFTFELDPSASGVTINGRGHVTQDAVALLAGLTGVTLQVGSFTNIEAYTGNASDTNILQGSSGNNDWQITGANAGTINGSSFSNFARIQGWTDGGSGVSNDTFTFAGALGSISQLIDGNGGNNEIVGAENATNAWVIDSANGGSVNSNTFLDIQTLTGGDTVDDTFTFELDPSASGVTINGRGHVTQDAVALLAGLTGVTLQVGSFTNIEAYTGNASDTNILQGSSGNNDWQITGANAGTINGSSFSNFARIQGWTDGGSGVSNDTFTFAGALGSISQLIDGNGGNNEIVGSESAANAWVIDTGNDSSVNGNNFVNIQTLTGGDTVDDTFTFELDPSASGVTINGRGHVTQDVVALGSSLDNVTLQVGSFANVEMYAGNALSGNVLQGSNSGDSWLIDGINGGVINGIRFADFANLTGGSGNDIFTFENGGSLSGLLDGGLGSDTANYMAQTTVSVSLSSLAAIEILQGNNSDSTLIGTDGGDNWSIDGENDGSIGTLTFTNFNNLTGGSGDDVFTFEDGGSLTGMLSGGLGSDTANYMAQTTVSVALSNLTAIEILQGNNNDSTLIGNNGGDNWLIDGNNDGSVGTVTFTNFNNLTGGSGNDVFTFENGGSLSGILNGGLGSDTANYMAQTTVSVALSNLTEIEILQGNDTDSTLIGTDGGDSWVIDGNNDGSVGTVAFTNFNNLTGGSGDDVFTFENSGLLSGILNGGLGSDTANYMAQTTVSVDLSNLTAIELLQGNDSDSTLIGTDGGDSWVISDNNDGSVGGVTFTNFNNLTGGGGDDNFRFEAAGVITGLIDAGGGSDTVDYSLQNTVVVNLGNALNGVINAEIVQGNGSDSTLIGTNGGDSWLIDGNDAGTIGSLRFIAFNNLTGGSGDDVFTFEDGGSLSGILNGGLGFDTANYTAQMTVSVALSNLAAIELLQGNDTDSTLIGTDSGDSWIIDGNNDGSLGTIAFENFNNLTGGSGDDVFTFENGGSLTGMLNGGLGSDTANYMAQSTVSVALSNLTAIELLQGNDSDSTLIGTDGGDSWVISGNNDGSVGGVTFTDFNNLTGGGGDDTFRFEVAGVIAGLIDAGAGSDTVDYSLQNTVVVNLDSAFGAVTNAEIIQGNDTDSTLIGSDGGDNWSIDGNNAGTVGNVRFIAFNNLTGGSGDDVFTFEDSGSLSGILNGGLGADRANYMAQTTVSVALSNLTDIELLQGNDTDSTLIGTDGGDSWLIDGNNDGSVGTVAFTNFNNLTGGSGDDVFTFENSGLLTGILNGGLGSDTANYMAQTTVSVALSNLTAIELLQGNDSDSTLIGTDGGDNWVINGNNDGTVAGVTFTNFNNLTGGGGDDTFRFEVAGIIAGLIDAGAGSDTVDYSLQNTVVVNLDSAFGAVTNAEIIQGNNTDSTLIGIDGGDNWSIDGSNAGTVGNVRFIAFNNLTGGSGDDVFTFEDGGSLSGILNGGLGADRANYMAQTTVSVALSNLTDIELLQGNDTDSTLIGTDGGDSWLIDGNNDGSVGTIAFENFNNLTGGSGDDVFTFENGGSLTGMLNGGLGSDTANYMAQTTVSVSLSDLIAIEFLEGNNSDSTLIGTDGGDSWVINGDNDGTVGGVTFTNFNNLTGGAGDDTFQFEATGTIAGLIDAGGGSDTVDYSLQSTVVVNLDGVLSGVANAEIIQGNDSDSTLIGTSGGDSWLIDGNNAGTVAGIRFTAFNNLTGGAGDDVFSFEDGGSLSGIINGGLGSDTANYMAQTIVSVALSNLTAIELLQGNDNNSTLIGTDGGDSWLINGNNAGLVGGVTFTGFNNITGGAGDDVFGFTDSGSLAGVFDAGAGQDTADYSLQTSVNVSLSDFSNVEIIRGNDLDSTLAANNVSNTWLISDENDGTVAGIQFIDFNNLTGGSAVDIFTVEDGGSITGVINGGVGAGITDVLDIMALNRDVSVAVDDLIAADFNVLDIEQIQGNTDSSLSNTLIGSNTNNTWNIDGVNAGSLNFSTTNISFTGFENLIGGNLNDSFNLNNLDHVTGLINGGGGADEINMLSLGRDITVQLGPVAGANADDTLYVDNVETVNANSSRNNTLIGNDIASAWRIDGPNTSTIERLAGSDPENTVAFSGFSTLNGGNNDDTFEIINATNIVQINGGAGNDSVDYSNIVADVNITMGNSLAPSGVNIDGIEGLIGNNDGNGSFNSSISVADGNNTWTIVDFDGAGIADGVNDGQFQDANGNVVTFINFNILQGGDGTDIFDVRSGASITGYIHGGAGADELRLAIGAAAGQTRFIGGADSDSVLLTGGGSDFDASYRSDVGGDEQLAYTNSAGSVYTVSYDEVETVQDNVEANNFTIFGSSGVDAIDISTGYVSVNGSTALQYANRTNLILSGEAGDTFDLVDALNLGNGSLTLNDASLTNSSNSIISADSLALNSVGDIGTSAARVNTNINSLFLNNVSGDVYLSETSAIELQEFTTTGVFDLISVGNVTQQADAILTSSNDFIIETTGTINLTNQNQLSGSINLTSPNSITFSNAVDSNFSGINTQNLTLDIAGNITDSGTLNVSGILELRANNNDVTLDNATNNFNIVNINEANNVTLADTANLSLNNINISGLLEVSTESLVTTAAISAGSMSLNATGLARLDTELQSTAGDISVNANQIDQNANISSSGSIVLSSQQGIDMDTNVTSTAINGDISYIAANNVNVSLLSATEGTVFITSSNGQIVDNNADADNIVANRAEMHADNGIGVNDAIETQLNILFAENTQGQVNINNRGNITLERLATSGDIEFNNSNLDGSDINFMPGSVDAGYDVGSLIMSTEGGNFFGVGPTPEFSNADIVARNATFIDVLRVGSFGSLTRPLVLRIRDSVVISVRANLNPQFAEPLPEIDSSGSSFNFSSFDTISAIAGGQLVELESLVEVDPAIFTDLRNYNHDEIAVRLPNDQLFEEEDEEAESELETSVGH